jgi:ADP-dependent NAD(P)H-hydrate dehydratase / NAD(P)H-hydrate epimerase
MKIFSCEQIRAIDAYTIEHEPIAPIDLMERAAGKIFSWLTEKFDRSSHFIIFTGPGNNGGDGLAVARMLHVNRYSTDTYCLKLTDKTSHDFNLNLKRLDENGYTALRYIENENEIPVISSGDIVIDAIFGSGLTRPADGLAKEVIKRINLSDSSRVSIDIPSGLFCNDNTSNDSEGILMADYTLSFQFPKLAFMFPDTSGFTGEWTILPIDLDESAIRNSQTSYHLLDIENVASLLMTRKKFDHKGKFGHGLYISGSYGKMGAAVLGAKAALRTGIGLVTCHIPICGYTILQSSVPEAMVITDSSENIISEIKETERFSAIGVGPGLGTEKATQKAVKNLLENNNRPIVIDADGLNILSLNKDWFSLLGDKTIITPHVGEFERLSGPCANGYERLMKQVEFSKKYNCTVILKGAYSSITTSAGIVYFNNTGNPGMATGGSGDVLTGIILSLLSQGYTPENAAILGVYLHGLAGDLAVKKLSVEAIIASDIIKHTGMAFNMIRDYKKNNN